MRTLTVFNNVTLDGYFTGVGGDLSWAYEGDNPEYQAFVSSNAQGGGTLALGRVTYEIMNAYWPTEAAMQALPKVAEGMNRSEKVVFSHSLTHSDWQNSRFVDGDPVFAVRTLKQQDGPGSTILGNGSIIAPLAAAGLIDRTQAVVCPVALGAGRTMFDGVPGALHLRLIGSGHFGNGKVVNGYESLG